MVSKLWKALTRKRIDENFEGKGEMARVLGFIDLLALGVGTTLGIGVYVLAGTVSKTVAGPAVCVSFLIAAFASALAAVCYAEFASRVPKSGSAYTYSYVTIGEFVAFIIGWNLILEYVIGTASVARGLSEYIDNLLDHKMHNFFNSTMPMNVSFLSKSPDLFAFCIILLLVILLSFGIQESSNLNILFTVANLLTILTVIIAGSIKADPSNWNISIKNIPEKYLNDAGDGGFLPFGISGVMIGAAKCFYGFVGFDTVAAAGEEAKNPQKNVPLAIIISIFITFGVYFSISTVLTMMWPYYDQDAEAPFPHVFRQLGWPVIMWIVNIGAIFALCTALLGAMYPLPRILYAMASDGVIFKFLSKIHPKSQVPVMGTLVSGLLIGIMTLLFNLEQLIDMMSIGTLLAYTIVAICVLILRYHQNDDEIMKNSNLLDNVSKTPLNYFSRVFNLCNQKIASEFSSAVVNWGIVLFSILIFIFCLIITYLNFDNSLSNIFGFIILSIVILLILLIFIAIYRQPKNPKKISFKVPLVPLVPCCSIFINLLLMVQLDSFTWIRFLVWMIIGLSIYFFYGIHNSVQGQKDLIKLTSNSSTTLETEKYVTKF